ncbi:MAG: RNHCP domain-containing protein [Parcubacteria group bacterium]|nr:RNHCP domain-containing protein [Parcubacteria group bacterium]
MSTTFRHMKEDFVCEKCGMHVAGNGYTNHCPKCLWSKHVDIHPGDRAASCGGMMKPESFFIKRTEEYIVHTCKVCGHVKNNRVASEDDRDAVIALSAYHEENGRR